MSAQLAPPRMPVEEFLDWTDTQEGNFERDDLLPPAEAGEGG